MRTDTDVDAKLAVYRLQGAAYAAAIEASTGLVVEAIEFVFTRPGGAVSRRIDDVRGAIAEVTRLAVDGTTNADARTSPV